MRLQGPHQIGQLGHITLGGNRELAFDEPHQACREHALRATQHRDVETLGVDLQEVDIGDAMGLTEQVHGGLLHRHFARRDAGPIGEGGIGDPAVDQRRVIFVKIHRALGVPQRQIERANLGQSISNRLQRLKRRRVRLKGIDLSAGPISLKSDRRLADIGPHIQDGFHRRCISCGESLDIEQHIFPIGSTRDLPGIDPKPLHRSSKGGLDHGKPFAATIVVSRHISLERLIFQKPSPADWCICRSNLPVVTLAAKAHDHHHRPRPGLRRRP